MITWDETKRRTNLAKHGVDLSDASAFEWETALVWQDTRFAYGEARMAAIGFIGPRLHVAVFTEREGGRRIISLRKANRRETRRYAED